MFAGIQVVILHTIVQLEYTMGLDRLCDVPSSQAPVISVLSELLSRTNDKKTQYPPQLYSVFAYSY